MTRPEIYRSIIALVENNHKTIEESLYSEMMCSLWAQYDFEHRIEEIKEEFKTNNIFNPYDNYQPKENSSNEYCPICGASIGELETVYINSLGGVIGCEHCAKEKQAYEVFKGDCDD